MSESAASRRRRVPVFEMVVAVLVLALVAEGFVLLKPKPERPAEAQQAISAGQTQKVESFGEESAPIKIEFYAPLVLEWHQQTIGLLRKYNEDHPGRIFVKLMPMGQTECDADMQKRGYTCAVIFINSKNDFTLPDGKKVELYQRPNQSTSTYNSEDVITILDQLSQASEK